MRVKNLIMKAILKMKEINKKIKTNPITRKKKKNNPQNKENCHPNKYKVYSRL
jgi:hypothetical protein